MMTDDLNNVNVSPRESINLREIIKERKTERKLKAERKRQVDLQRIKDMRSTIGIDPLQRFPKEIWTKIFGELNSEDLANVWRVHPLFQDLMESTGIRDILLPQVLSVDAFKCCLFTRDKSKMNEHLRLISKSARSAFDRKMENNIEKRIEEKMEILSFPDYLWCATFRLSESDDRRMLTRLLNNFGDCKNPGRRFYMRGLSVSLCDLEWETGASDDDDEDDEEEDQNILLNEDTRNQFKDNISTLLQLIGGQIWHFRFFWKETRPVSPTEVCALFQRWLCLMPNLKWLEFYIPKEEEKIMMIDEGKAVLRKHPLPHLAFLKRITLHHRCHQAQTEIYEAVIAANQQIKIADFTIKGKLSVDCIPSHVIKSLPLTGFAVHHEEWLELKLNKIERIPNCRWPLKSILLNLQMSKEGIDGVFRFLEKFPTLETVRLVQLRGPSIGNDIDHAGYLQLPNLTTLSLQVDKPEINLNSENSLFFFSLQFLLYCKRLRTLEWRLRCIDDLKLRKCLKEYERKENVVDFRAGLRTLHESNIWSVFPSLDVVHVEVGELDRVENIAGLGDYSRCSHKYNRAEVGSKVTVSHFLKSHVCSRKATLHKCVMLIDF